MLNILEGLKREMYSDRLIKSIKDLKKAWKDVCEAVKDAKMSRKNFTQVAKDLLEKRQEERDKRLYDIRMENYASRGSAFGRGRAGRVRVEGLANIGVELPGIDEHVARHVRKRHPAFFAAQRRLRSDLPGTALDGPVAYFQKKTPRVVNSWRIDATDGDGSLKSLIKKKFEAAPAADERGPFQIWRYGSEDPIDLDNTPPRTSRTRAPSTRTKR